MFKLIKISSTLLAQEHFKLPDDYNWGEDEPFKEGEWVTVSKGEWVTVSDGKIARITGSDVVASHNTFPIYLSNEIDPAVSVTILKGAYSFKTDCYDKSATISAGTLLTVKGDGNTTQARGILAPAETGDPIRGICEGKDSEKNTITVRMLDGGATA